MIRAHYSNKCSKEGIHRVFKSLEIIDRGDCNHLRVKI